MEKNLNDVKYIRMDDYPHGKPQYHLNPMQVVNSWVKIFEEKKINYILGVSPLLLKIDDIIFLKNTIKNGKIVMHGFNHKFDHKGDWNTIVSTWEHGGEFMNMSEDTILQKYLESDKILSIFDSYDKTHFIPPFNCLTQELVNVLSESGVKYIHTCDKEYNEYNYKDIDFKNIEPIIAKYHKGYDHAHEVLKRMDNNDDLGQITLHWIFDCEFRDWLLNYERLINRLNEDTDYTRKW